MYQFKPLSFISISIYKDESKIRSLKNELKKNQTVNLLPRIHVENFVGMRIEIEGKRQERKKPSRSPSTMNISRNNKKILLTLYTNLPTV